LILQLFSRRPRLEADHRAVAAHRVHDLTERLRPTSLHRTAADTEQKSISPLYVMNVYFMYQSLTLMELFHPTL